MALNQNADHIAARAGSFEPQRQNNFTIEIYGLPGDDGQIIQLGLASISEIPGAENEIVEIPFQNEKVYVAGKASVAAITLSIRDYVDSQTREALLRWRKEVYDSETGKIGLARDYKKAGAIILTAPDGTEERVFDLQGCFLTNDPKGGLDMSASDQIMMEVTLSIDKVIQPLAV